MRRGGRELTDGALAGVRRRLGAALLAAAWVAGPGPAAGGITPAELVEVTDISGLAVSPDGRHVAFRTERPSIDDNSAIIRWHVASSEAAAVRELGGGGEPIWVDPGLLASEPPIWSRDGRWLYYRGLSEGAVQIWRAAADDSGALPITREEANVKDLVALSDGGLAYELGPSRSSVRQAEMHEYHEGILVDEQVDLAQNVFRGAIADGQPASQRLIGRWFERGGLLWKSPTRWRRLDPATLHSTDLPGAPRPTAAGRPGAASAVSAAGDVVLVNREEGRSSVQVRRGGQERGLTCEALECSRAGIVSAVWRPGHEQLLLTRSDRHHAHSLYLWDLASGSVRQVARSDGLLNGGRDAAKPCALTRAAAVCVVASAISPPQLQRIDLETGARVTLYDPNASLRRVLAPRAEQLEWQGSDGTRHAGTLLLPPRMTAGRAPLFINYYRCEGFLRGGVGDEWPFASLADAGFAAMCINAAPADGREDLVQEYRTALLGIAALVDLLDQRGLVDRSRVGMGGLSFGSEVTMWAAVHSNLLAAASIASLQFEPAYYWFTGVRGRANHQILRDVWGLGAPDETKARWKLLSPALNVERLRVPLLMQLPEQEARHVIELHARLTHSSTPTELYVFPEEPHIKVQPRHKLAAYRRNLDWFRFWLQGHVDPDPAKAEQYRRWRLLDARRRGSTSAAERTQP